MGQVPMLKLSLLLTCLLAAEARAGEPEVRSIVVPSELAAVTSNPEFSGIVWSPARRRYLVVTDDSGLKSQGTNHASLLLALGEDGKLDKTPIPIRGVRTINDPESICAGPKGTYFLITSHSPNHKNKTPAERRQLLQLTEDKLGLVVAGRLDLTNIKGKRSLFEIAGLPPDGRLDIEAIAYHAGALFIGIKSPLTEKGEAVILRLTNPIEAMRKGQLRESAVERFAAVPLCLPVEGRPVCQGISDMTFLSDDSLILSANAPKGGPKDHGGALWHLPAPVGKTPPVLLNRFPGLKPEGVTLTPTGRSLMVVFDCNDQAPKWTEVALPSAKKN
jgi:hypothetical protein